MLKSFLAAGMVLACCFPAFAMDKAQDAVVMEKETPVVKVSASLTLSDCTTLNRESRAYLEKSVNDFTMQADKDYADWQKEFKKDPSLGEFRQYEIKIESMPTMPSNRVIVQNWEIYCFTGGAHGSTAFIPWNYDRDSGKQLKLNDIFGDPKMALDLLSVESRVLLKAQGFDSDMMTDGTTPDLDNFAAFSLTSNGLKIRFQQYQVGPYAIGAPEVEIALQKLKNAQPKLEYWQKSR